MQSTSRGGRGGRSGRGGGGGGGQSCYVCGLPGHIRANCPQSGEVCRQCGQPGHVQASCLQRLCHVCQRPGHLMRECPQNNAFQQSRSGLAAQQSGSVPAARMSSSIRGGRGGSAGRGMSTDRAETAASGHAVDFRFFPPQGNYLDQSNLPEQIRNRELCLNCGQPRGLGHENYRQCEEPCQTCDLDSHKGQGCPQLYCSKAWWSRTGGVPDNVQIRPTEAQRADLATRHETFRNFPAPLQEQPVGQPKKRSAEEAGVASGPASPKRPKVSELLSVQLREVGTSEKELEDQDRKIDTVDREIEVMARELEIKKREIEAMAKDLAMKQRELEVMKREQASAKDGVRWKRQAIESQIREEALKERLHQEGSRQTQKDPYPRRF